MVAGWRPIWPAVSTTQPACREGREGREGRERSLVGHSRGGIDHHTSSPITCTCVEGGRHEPDRLWSLH